MIVRCTSCNAAYSVDDSKVGNKIFAFNCPKCSTENIIDNRIKAQKLADEKRDDRIGAASDQGLNDFNFEEPAPRKEASFNKSKDRFDQDESAESAFEFPDEKKKATAPVVSQELTNFDEEQPTLSKSKDIFDELGGDLEVSNSKTVSLDEKPLTEDDFDFSDDLILDEEPEPLAKKDKKKDKDELDDLDLDVLTNEIESLKEESESKEPEKHEIHAEGDFSIDDDLIFEEEPKSRESEKHEIRAEDDFSIDDDLILEEEPKSKESEKHEIRAEDDFLIDDNLILEEESKSHEELVTAAIPKEEEIVSSSEELLLDDDFDFDQLDDLSEKKPKKGEERTSEIGSDKEIEVVEIKNEELYSTKKKEEDDDITIDLNSLDIDLEEDKNKILNGENPLLDEIEEPLVGAAVATKPKEKQVTEEEDITLDLDDLDIPLEMSEDIKQGEIIDADEKLTLEDAGLTMDELTSEEISEISANKPAMEFEEEEDIKLSIDDIDPNLNVENIENEIIDNQEDIKLTIDEIDPELNVHNIKDKIEQESSTLSGAAAIAGVAAIGAAGIVAGATALSDHKSAKKKSGDDLLLLDEDIDRPAAKSAGPKLDEEYINLDEDAYYDEEEMIPSLDEGVTSIEKRGAVDFSIDYSINYSRIGAIIRLFGIYFIALIPHLIVFAIYSILSGILGFINNLIILSSGRAMLDFWAIQQNTIRYMISLGASSCGIVEEMPHFAGRDDIDYALQYGIRYPQEPSRLLAFLRLSMIGINLMALPHIIICILLSIAFPFFYIAGLFTILFTAKMPRIIFNFIRSYYRYYARVLSFITGLVDEYPPFKF